MEQLDWEPQLGLASYPEGNLGNNDKLENTEQTLGSKLLAHEAQGILPSLSGPTAVLTAFSKSSDTSLETRDRTSVTLFNRS